MQKKAKWFKYGAISFLVIIVAVMAIIFKAQPKSNIATEPFDLGCVEKIETVQVRDNSLTPLLNQGDNVKLYYGFYKCNQPQFGDIIAYHYTGNKEAPLAKIIKAVPGDRWEIRKDNEEFYQIFVNGTALKNSEGKIYQISEENAKVLKLYAQSYPIIPNEAYLILGNLTAGTVDSTKFGLISKNDIVGKIEK